MISPFTFSSSNPSQAFLKFMASFYLAIIVKYT